MKISIGNCTLGKGTPVGNAEALADLFTAGQLNRLAEKFMGKKFNKVGAKKIAAKLWPVLVEAAGTAAKEKPAGPGRGNKMYTIVHPKKAVKVDDLPYQCQHFIEMFLKECKAGQEKQVTKDELLAIFKKHGFKTRGNPWNNFHFYRRTLIKRGVMKK